MKKFVDKFMIFLSIILIIVIGIIIFVIWRISIDNFAQIDNKPIITNPIPIITIPTQVNNPSPDDAVDKTPYAHTAAGRRR